MLHQVLKLHERVFFLISSLVASSIGLDSEVVIANGHLHVNPIHPLQAANCCRNSRLVVDGNDLMLFNN